MPILQKRINKETFVDVLEKVSSRLAGWKGRFLSLAGRVTLTKAVLSSIPVHSMSTIALPMATINGLNKISRAFLWGSTGERKKQHLLAWKKVCSPKSEGGLGIRTSKDMNRALLAKVGWRLLKDKESLWAKVLRSKYKVGDARNLSWTIPKSNWSSTWRSVGFGLREVVQPGISWVVGDGQDVRFWTDKWLSNEALIESVIGEVPEEYMEVRVKELWRDGIGWMMDKITPLLPAEKCLELGAIVVDNVTGAKDRMAWKETLNGEFTVKSAYSMLTTNMEPRQSMAKLFERIWKVIAPERVKVFFWLVGNQAIMSNSERYRRHITASPICQVCKGDMETTLHILRDCPAMKGIWQRIIPTTKRQSFFHKPLLEWIYDNLSGELRIGDIRWTTLFAMTSWWGWKWRCDNVFGTNRKCRDRVKFVKNLAKEVTDAHGLKMMGNVVNTSVEKLVGWNTPKPGYFKMNTDGASKGNPGLATAGGVLRDERGKWCGGFALNIGRCSAPLAELWGVYYGLYISWEKGVRCLELEVDSKVVVDFLNTGISDSHPLSFLVHLCHGFLSKDWSVRVSHVYREANRLADGLANYAFSLPLGFHGLDYVPKDVDLIMIEDDSGSLRPRHVRL